MPPAPTIRPDRKRRQALVVLCLVQLLVAFDQAYVMAALPSIERELSFAAGQVQWLITGYAVAFGGFVLLGGRVADVLGRRRALTTGLGVFACGAAVAGLAPAASILVVARALQGLGVALIAPAAVSTLTTTFVERRARTVALGIWAAVGALGTALGAVTGGLVTQMFGWAWLSVLDPALAALAIALSWLVLPAGARSRRRLGIPGAVLATGGISAGVLAVSRMSADGLTGPTLVAAGLAAVLLAAFALAERRVGDPLLPLDLVRAPCVSAANLVAMIVAVVVASMFLLLTLTLQRVLGYAPGTAGLALLVLSATGAIWALVAGRIVQRTGSRIIVAWGLGLLAVALVSFARLPLDAVYVRDLLPGLLLAAAGTAFAFVGLNNAALRAVPAHHAGLGSGLLATSQQVGAAVGISVLSSIAAAHEAASRHGAAPALAHGLDVAFRVDAGVALAGVGAALVLLRGRSCAPAPAQATVPTPAAVAA